MYIIKYKKGGCRQCIWHTNTCVKGKSVYVCVSVRAHARVCACLYVHRQFLEDTQETSNTGLPLGEGKGWLGYMKWKEIFVSFEFCIVNVLPVKYKKK